MPLIRVRRPRRAGPPALRDQARSSSLTGKLEILRIRDDARQRLGPAFSLPAFHGAVLDHGSLPMPTLARSITHWLDQAG